MSGKQTLGLGMRSRNYVQTSCCNGPRTMDTMDAGQGTHPSSFRPYCHIQGGFCVVSASWFSFSGESRSHVCPGKPGKMEAQRGLCLFRMGIPRYRMGYRGSFLVLWEEDMGEGVKYPRWAQSCGSHVDICPVPGKREAET